MPSRLRAAAGRVIGRQADPGIVLAADLDAACDLPAG
jgi:hypothetical protein